MIDAVMVGIDVEHDRDEPMAKEILQTLVQHYPGHPWYVSIVSGVVHVKKADVNHEWGMCIHYDKIKGDAAVRQKRIVMAGGEFLERCRLKRGAKREEDVVTSVDGIPQKKLRLQ